MYQAIQCDQHDYLEICCMRHYPVKLELIDGRVLNARPVTTRTLADKTEWLDIELLDGPIPTANIRLDQLSSITPDRACKAEFGKVEFVSADHSPAN